MSSAPGVLERPQEVPARSPLVPHPFESAVNQIEENACTDPYLQSYEQLRGRFKKRNIPRHMPIVVLIVPRWEYIADEDKNGDQQCDYKKFFIDVTSIRHFAPG